MDLLYVDAVEEEWLVPCREPVESEGAEHLVLYSLGPIWGGEALGEGVGQVDGAEEMAEGVWGLSQTKQTILGADL